MSRRCGFGRQGHYLLGVVLLRYLLLTATQLNPGGPTFVSCYSYAVSAPFILLLLPVILKASDVSEYSVVVEMLKNIQDIMEGIH